MLLCGFVPHCPEVSEWIDARGGGACDGKHVSELKCMQQASQVCVL